MGAAADAKVAAAALADRFVHECSKTARIDAKLDALILRETFLERSESIETSLVRVKDASEQACGSDALGKLLDIVVALSAILEKDKPKTPSANVSSGRSAYKLASLAKLATTPAAATSKASSVLGGNTLLHHLSKTVESKVDGDSSMGRVAFFVVGGGGGSDARRGSRAHRGAAPWGEGRGG
jgi:hypothetical protein